MQKSKDSKAWFKRYHSGITLVTIPTSWEGFLLTTVFVGLIVLSIILASIETIYGCTLASITIIIYFFTIPADRIKTVYLNKSKK